MAALSTIVSAVVLTWPKSRLTVFRAMPPRGGEPAGETISVASELIALTVGRADPPESLRSRTKIPNFADYAIVAGGFASFAAGCAVWKPEVFQGAPPRERHRPGRPGPAPDCGRASGALCGPVNRPGIVPPAGCLSAAEQTNGP